MRNRIIITTIVIALVVIGAFTYFKRSGQAPPYEFTVAQRGNIIQEVNVIGHVKPAESVDLAFEKGGKVSRVYVAVGERINAGKLLVSLSNSELVAQSDQAKAGVESAKAQLQQYQAALAIQQAKLDELKRGTRQEEIQISETKVENARKALTDAEINLTNVKNKADADLQEDYDGALTAVAASVTVGTNAIFIITDIQVTDFSGGNADDNIVANGKGAAVLALLGGQNAGRMTNDSIGKLNGGAKATTDSAQSDPSHENVDNTLIEVKNALQKVKVALDVIPTDLLSSTEKSDINTEKNNIDSEITTLTNKQQAIAVQKAANSGAVSAAEANVNDAQNTLLSSEDELALKKASATPEQISAQEAQVAQAEANIASQQAQIKQAEANVRKYQAQLAKTVIRSPINGIITKQDAQVGEIVSANMVIISVISETRFEIKANVPEVDIAKIKIGNPAHLTLDAYGRDVIFEARVTKIDPAATIIEGVTTYKITLEFDIEDKRIRSSMTANLDISSDRRENVISIPQRSIVRRNGNKFVRILDGEILREEAVEIGLRGSDGNIEIISGINAGDKVITFIEE